MLWCETAVQVLQKVLPYAAVLSWVIMTYYCPLKFYFHVYVWMWMNCIVWCIHTYVCAFVYPFMEVRGGVWMSCSITLYFIPLSHGLSLNMELYWWPASCHNLFIYSFHISGVNSCVCPCLIFLCEYWGLEPRSSCLHGKLSYTLSHHFIWSGVSCRLHESSCWIHPYLVAEDSFVLLILLLLPPKIWHFRHMPPFLRLFVLFWETWFVFENKNDGS